MGCELARWLGGSLSIERGARSDYRSLERFHYVLRKPAVWAGVWRAMYQDHREDGGTGGGAEARIVAVGVMAYPVPCCRARATALGLKGGRYDAGKIRWLNGNLRTISRVIVHPQFRGIGLARALVRTMCHESGVRYVEALARMGHAVPFFERGGMRRHAAADSASPMYYLWDRNSESN